MARQHAIEDMKRQEEMYKEEEKHVCHCQPRYVQNKIHGRYINKDEEPLQ